MLFPQLTGVDLSLILWNSIAEFTSFGAFVLSDAWGSFVISDNTCEICHCGYQGPARGTSGARSRRCSTP